MPSGDDGVAHRLGHDGVDAGGGQLGEADLGRHGEAVHQPVQAAGGLGQQSRAVGVDVDDKGPVVHVAVGHRRAD